MEKHLFDMIPSNFFTLLASPSKEVNADCLFITFQSLSSRLSYACPKDEFIMMLNDYFENHFINIPDDEITGTPHDKALAVYNRFKDYGWIEEDSSGDNYEVIVNYTDYAVKVLSCLIDLDNLHDISYSGLIYSIAAQFRNFEYDRGSLAFDNAYKLTMSLREKLQNLNSSIKKYIQRILDEGKNNDLNELLDTLLLDYQAQIVDRAYYNLTTYDNPSKFQNEIIDHINKIMENDTLTDDIIRQIVERENVDYDEAEHTLYMQSEYIKDSFDHIQYIMDEINMKNKRFIASAINRIEFLLNNKKDIEGKINNIIKNINEDMEITQIGQVYSIDEESLFSPRSKSEVIVSEDIIHERVDDAIIQKEIAKLHLTNRLSKRFIDDLVLKHLEDQKSFKASTLPLETQDDKTILLLIFLYGFSNMRKYEIELSDDEITINHYQFKDFTVRRKL